MKLKKMRQKEAEADMKDDEILDDVWGDTEDMPTASKLQSVGRVAKTYITGDDEDSSEDDEAAERELPDGGVRVIAQSVAMTMEAVMDMAFGVGDSDDDEEDSMAVELINIDDL